MKNFKLRKSAIVLVLAITLSSSLGTIVGLNTNTITAEAKVSANVSVSTVQNCLNRFYHAYFKAHQRFPWINGPLKVDNICGNSTNVAIKAFQKDCGLKQDGDCGTDTWQRLSYYNY